VETSSQVDEGATLEGSSWNLVTLNGQEPLPDTTITASFGAGGTLTGSDGCNRYSASYQVDGSALSISPGISTMMACPEPIMGQAQEYMVALAAVASYQIQDDALELRDAADNMVLTFSAQITGLTGTSWNVISYNNGREAVVSVIVGTELTADFGADGTLSGLAGCNNYTAAYEADDEGNISIGPAAATRMMCAEPAGVMEQEGEYLAALESAATYRLEGDTMEMRTAAGALAATFQRAP